MLHNMHHLCDLTDDIIEGVLILVKQVFGISYRVFDSPKHSTDFGQTTEYCQYHMVLNVITREHIHSINIELTFEHFEHIWIHSSLRHVTNHSTGNKNEFFKW